MHADLESADGTEHVLYDPSIAKVDALDDAARAGSLLAMYSDGGLDFRVYVDEELPDNLRARISTTTKDVLLRVPGGTLVASALGDLGDRTKAVSTLEVPAGNYLVDAHELEYDWDRDIDPVLREELGDSYHRERRARPIAGALTLAGLGCVVGGALAWSPIVLIAGGAALVGGVGLGRATNSKPHQARKDAIARRFPGLVLVLRRIDDVASYAGKQLTFTD